MIHTTPKGIFFLSILLYSLFSSTHIIFAMEQLINNSSYEPHIFVQSLTNHKEYSQLEKDGSIRTNHIVDFYHTDKISVSFKIKSTGEKLSTLNLYTENKNCLTKILLTAKQKEFFYTPQGKTLNIIIPLNENHTTLAMFQHSIFIAQKDITTTKIASQENFLSAVNLTALLGTSLLAAAILVFMVYKYR